MEEVKKNHEGKSNCKIKNTASDDRAKRKTWKKERNANVEVEEFEKLN